MKKELIKLSGILCVITLVAALLLAGVNKLTAPKIAQADAKAANEAMKKMLPDADDFEKINDDLYIAKKGNEEIGACVNVTVTGYGGDINMMVGINLPQSTVAGIEILSHSETAGLGAKANEDSFKSQLKGKQPALTVVKNDTTNANELKAITGATITSRAVAQGIRQAYSIIEKREG